MTDSSSSKGDAEDHITSLAAELLKTHQALEIEKKKEGGASYNKSELDKAIDKLKIIHRTM